MFFTMDSCLLWLFGKVRPLLLIASEGFSGQRPLVNLFNIAVVSFLSVLHRKNVSFLDAVAPQKHCFCTSFIFLLKSSSF